MKTRKALAATVLAAFSLSVASAAFAQSGTPPATSAAPAKPAASAAPAPAAPAPAATATAKPAAAKPAATAKAGAKSTKKEAATAAAKVGPRSIIGEVVDPACWIVNGAKGPSHKECAIACAKAGQVLGIVENKTQKFYMIATDKPGEDPNKGLIDYVGQVVLVKGRVYSRGGATGIKVTSVEPYSATAIAQ
jgi:hypothetical protein